jgi:hypothetical protein
MIMSCGVCEGFFAEELVVVISQRELLRLAVEQRCSQYYIHYPRKNIIFQVVLLDLDK